MINILINGIIFTRDTVSSNITYSLFHGFKIV